jgi:hypothetical protein
MAFDTLRARYSDSQPRAVLALLLYAYGSGPKQLRRRVLLQLYLPTLLCPHPTRLLQQPHSVFSPLRRGARLPRGPPQALEQAACGDVFWGSARALEQGQSEERESRGDLLLGGKSGKGGGSCGGCGEKGVVQLRLSSGGKGRETVCNESEKSDRPQRETRKRGLGDTHTAAGPHSAQERGPVVRGCSSVLASQRLIKSHLTSTKLQVGRSTPSMRSSDS